MTALAAFGGLATAALDDAERSQDQADVPRELVQRSGRPMATDVSVQIAAPSSRWAEAAAAADSCMAWFDEVDQRLSRFRPDSELSQLNASAGEWFAASDMLYECAALAIASAAASNGLFDPTMLRQLCELGYDRDFAALAYQETAHTVQRSAASVTQTPIERAAWKQIDLDPARRMLRLPAGVALDFGGIAKGWAADVALARYCASFPGALINVGGDLRALGGPQPGQLWSVGIRDPRLELAGPPDATTYLATVSLSRGAMATSGAVRRWWLRDGQRQHHLLDPRTGQPMNLWMNGDNDPGSLLASVTAFAPTAAQAEVAAKVALLRGYPLALSSVESAWERYGALGPRNDPDAGVALALVFGNGEIVFSKNLNDYLATWGTDGAMLPLVVRSTRPYLSLSDFRYLEHLS
jgi:thiamine biosynthesis lipoprotein